MSADSGGAMGGDIADESRHTDQRAFPNELHSKSFVSNFWGAVQPRKLRFLNSSPTASVRRATLFTISKSIFISATV